MATSSIGSPLEGRGAARLGAFPCRPPRTFRPPMHRLSVVVVLGSLASWLDYCDLASSFCFSAGMPALLPPAAIARSGSCCVTCSVGESEDTITVLVLLHTTRTNQTAFFLSVLLRIRQGVRAIYMLIYCVDLAVVVVRNLARFSVSIYSMFDVNSSSEQAS